MKLCFLDAHAFEGGAVRGSALVTDERTRPLEFRVTDPVETTELQKVLYGAVLDEHLLGDLCGVPLLEALREEPDYVLVQNEALLSLQDACDRPVLWLGRDEAERTDGEGTDGEADASDSSVEAPARPGVVIGYHGDGESEPIQRARTGLRAIAENYDLLEPFERMEEAVERLRAQAEAG